VSRFQFLDVMTAYPQKITVEEMRASGVKQSPPFKSLNGVR
jgi:hypothetical protein